MTLCTLKSYESRFKNICHCCFSKTYVMFEILAILWIFSWNWNPRKIFQIRTVSNKITVCKINISIQPRFFVNLLISKKHSDLQNKYLIIYPYLGQNVNLKLITNTLCIRVFSKLKYSWRKIQKIYILSNDSG